MDIKPFPLDALGELKPVVMAISRLANSHPITAAFTTLGMVNLAMQPLFTMKSLGKSPHATSLALLASVESGGGKSSTLELFTKYEKGAYVRYIDKFYSEYIDEKKSYDRKKRQYEKQLEKAYAKFDRNDVGQQNDLSVLENSEPIAPKDPHLYLDDITIQGFLEELQDYDYLGIITDEGGVFSGGWMMQKEQATASIAHLCNLWSMNDTTIKRKGVGRIVLRNKRVTILIMLQDYLVSRFFQPDFYKQGLTPRFIVAEPPEFNLSDWRHDMPQSKEEATIIVDRFMNWLYRKYASCRDVGMSVGTLLPEENAEKLLLLYSAQCKMKAKDEWQAVKQTAHRAAEQCARLAVTLQFYADCWEGENLLYRGEYIEDAKEIINWNVNEQKRLLFANSKSQQEKDDIELLEYIEEKFIDLRFEARNIYHNKWGDSKRVKSSLARLVNDGCLQELRPIGKERDPRYLFIKKAHRQAVNTDKIAF